VRAALVAVHMPSCDALMSYLAAPSYPSPIWCLHMRVCGLTSEIPFLCIRRYRVVHEILRGFFLWRNRDSVLPFWKRKILLSPRTYSFPYSFRQRLSPQLP
jgi:hypothetical protein